MLTVRLNRRSFLATALVAGGASYLADTGNGGAGTGGARPVDRLDEVSVSVGRLTLSSASDALPPSLWYLASGHELPPPAAPLAERPLRELRIRETCLEDHCALTQDLEYSALARAPLALPPVSPPAPVFRFLHRRIPFLCTGDLDLHLLALQRYAAPAASPRVAWGEHGMEVVRDLKLSLQFTLAYHVVPARLGVLLSEPGPALRRTVRDLLHAETGHDPGDALAFAWEGTVHLTSLLPAPEVRESASREGATLPYVLEGGASSIARRATLPRGFRYRERGAFGWQTVDA